MPNLITQKFLISCNEVTNKRVQRGIFLHLPSTMQLEKEVRNESKNNDKLFFGEKKIYVV